MKIEINNKVVNYSYKDLVEKNGKEKVDILLKEMAIEWLSKKGVKNYELIEDENYGYIINVNENVNLNFKNLDFLPFKFGTIKGDFIVAMNSLEDLEGCPDIVEGYFSASHNKIKNLKYFPKKIKGDIYLGNNEIEELENLPKNVKTLELSSNKLTSLKGCPEMIKGNLNIDFNDIKTLIGFPINIKGNIYMDRNEYLISLTHEKDDDPRNKKYVTFNSRNYNKNNFLKYVEDYNKSYEKNNKLNKILSNNYINKLNKI